MLSLVQSMSSRNHDPLREKGIRVTGHASSARTEAMSNGSTHGYRECVQLTLGIL